MLSDYNVKYDNYSVNQAIKKYNEIQENNLELNNKIKELMELKKEIMTDENVKKYLELKEMESVKKFHDILNSIIMYSQAVNDRKNDLYYLNQIICEHPVMFVLRDVYDQYEGQRYYHCKCLECGKLLSNIRRKDLKSSELVFSKKYVSDQKVMNEYQKLKKEKKVKGKRLVKELTKKINEEN